MFSFEEDWEIVEEFLKKNGHEIKPTGSEFNYSFQSTEKQSFSEYKNACMNISEEYKQHLKEFDAILNEKYYDYENKTKVNTEKKRKVDGEFLPLKIAKKRKVVTQNQESGVTYVYLGDVATKNFSSLRKCECVFDVIVILYGNIEKFFNIKFSTVELPDKIDTSEEAKDIFHILENTFERLIFMLEKKSTMYQRFPEALSQYLDKIALDVSRRVTLYNSKNTEWNDIADDRYKYIYDKIEFKDLITLLIYQINHTKNQFEEVKSVLLEAFSFGFRGSDKTKDLLIKTIILMKTGSIPQEQCEQEFFIKTINSVIKRNVIQYYWCNSVKSVTKIVADLKEKFKLLNDDELTRLPIEKDNLVFHLSFLKNKARIFENYAHPFLCGKDMKIKSKKYLCRPYTTLTRSLVLIYSIAEILLKTT
ncbi:hypothetical protein NGRA_0296 [Nosema granulosis]|uniref:Uncharacterized protein n=1 Tax=Nosema granulosis TaxID=83296 RepID=A0A9P6KZP9_9MICR|nr:hypothetical protein NGRA_0296 [Nosema granulosis]